MRKNTKTSKSSRKAFTLLELILVIAIMVIVIPMIYGTFYLIQVSHARVVVINDAKDYASLNAMAIDNVIANASAATASGSVGGGYTAAIYIDSASGDLYLKQGTGAAVRAFDYPQYHIADGSQKWKLNIVFTVDSSSKTVTYTIKVLDSSKPVGSNVTYSIESSVYLPNGNRKDTEMLVSSSGSVLNFSNP
jgi:prepilin-type N-terminal cleavage/methylation domain-containing protein